MDNEIVVQLHFRQIKSTFARNPVKIKVVCILKEKSWIKDFVLFLNENGRVVTNAYEKMVEWLQMGNGGLRCSLFYPYPR